MPKVPLDQYPVSNYGKKNGYLARAMEGAAIYLQSNQQPSRVLKLQIFLNHRYLIAPSRFLFHEEEDEEVSAWCYSRACDVELQAQTHIHLHVKWQPRERVSAYNHRTWYN